MADEYEFDDDVFDDIDEADLAELERPAKRQRTVPAAPESDHLTLANRILKENFGYDAFRHEQAGVIESLMAGENALAIFPTGAGKSLCYQIPAIAFPELDAVDGIRGPSGAGVTIVVSPLLALMKDQVDVLQKRGISADSVDSTKKYEDLQAIYAKLRDFQLRILYCAPERLNNEGFVAMIKDVPGGIRLVAVDEAHCVSEWGHSFRPDYLKVARFVEEVQAERVVCLTATATPKVAEDICTAFNIKKDRVFKTSPYRPNLELHAKTIECADANVLDHYVTRTSGKAHKMESDKRFEELFRFLRANPGPTLVYVAMQFQAESHAGVLTRNGFNAAAFHAGLKTERKQQIQDAFMAGRIEIVCATIAFGMGIDKSNIRSVVHWDLASTVEEYSQQIGRAGRDGKLSRCMFFLAPSAFYLRELFARGDLPSRRSLAGLINDIFSLARGLRVHDVFKVNHYKQEREFDIRSSPLSIIYATLELHYGLFRAITPEYSTYKYEAMPSYFPRIQTDKSPEAKAIRNNAIKKTKYHDLDIAGACKKSGVSRMDIVRKLNYLDTHGVIKLQASGVEYRYQIQKQFPDTKAGINEIIDKVLGDMQTREKDAINRGQDVMNLITGAKCFALGLAEHFGMGLPNGQTSCGHCTWCMTKTPVRPPTKRVKATTAATIQPVLKAIDIRDDARFLARVAFGIKSPRVTQLKLDKSPVFQSLVEHDFEDLLAEFTKVCGKDAV
ncbi:P-loop containing nucleoside triphosphate hydrolase protein [Podospora conica]|nr:P-loop containing nucleoside triphosphate hydrolase protein [Schizothecium conicum]